ncbi:conserved hypothetical protein [Thermotomaculum hydrothermale]|uniref:Cation/H+ exchanger transmembrane domain-containing protein n=1 Tax=Thermotomaculum hydrothermale TaxID=981385 RepID=A0A7R6PVW2_9BACT|nr:cation:proton antiporter [Thermotomaculum hydrothermale]BBB33612.1 conserved hypothetical protein [Thermotomaculum hydrothermale]
MREKIKIFKVLAVLIVFSICFYYFKEAKEVFYFSDIVSPYFSLGFLIISALLLGVVANELGLPSLTGYLIAGMVFGPQVFNFINNSDIKTLELINSIALSFIAISAGGELKLESLKKNVKPIGYITVIQSIFVLAGIFVIFYSLGRAGFLIKNMNSTSLLFFSIFLGVIAVAKSPASTIAIINEYKAKGTFTDIVLGITMIKDVVVLLMFSVAFAFARNAISGVELSAKFFLSIFSHIFISGVAGVIFGFLMIVFFKYVAKEIGIFVVLASFISYKFASIVGLENMFMCMVAGFVVQNFSKQGSVLIDAIEGSHLPVYVIFFSIAGAGLDFSSLKSYWVIVLLFVVLRLILIYWTTYFGAAVSKTVESVKKYAWTGFITNAGLTLSMVILIDKEFKDFGSILKAIVISVIAVNQIIGPILFKIGIEKSGEATKLNQ